MLSPLRQQGGVKRPRYGQIHHQATKGSVASYQAEHEISPKCPDFPGWYNKEKRVPPQTNFSDPSTLAQLLGVTKERIEDQLQKGEIAGVHKPDGQWAIPRKQVMQLCGVETTPPVFINDPDGIVE